MQTSELPVVRLGISSCLLGWRVRWDGDHRLDMALLELFRDQVEWVPVCPELESGLGVPRAPIRLECRDGGVRAIEAQSGADRTAALRDGSRRRLRELEALKLRGYILKSGSPSCGLRDIPLWPEDPRAPDETGMGLHAAALARNLPDLPLIEARQLHEREAFTSFVTRAFRTHPGTPADARVPRPDPREHRLLARFDELADRERPR